MKIINKGNPKAPWWVGKTMTCPDCGYRIELEAGDFNHHEWIKGSGTSVEWMCRNWCGAMQLNRVECGALNPCGPAS